MRISPRLAAAALVAAFGCLAGAGCTDANTNPTIGTSGKGSDAAATDNGTNATATDTTAAADTGAPPTASCTGSALSTGFEALDPQCGFLEKCASLGNCYCGDKCPATKAPKCDPSLCPNSKPKCYCGEACKADQKKCPQYLCTAAGLENSAGCDEIDDCLFVNSPPPSWCGCQKMPSHAADCWCNAKNCSEPHPECPAAKCAGKNPNACIYVKGDDYTSCWCDTCGLFGEKAKCFFVLCPNGK